MNTQINNTKETEVKYTFPELDEMTKESQDHINKMEKAKYTFPELDEMTKESQDHINKMETKLNCNLGILVK
jgi:beta-N-acetylglucosaminidase